MRWFILIPQWEIRGWSRHLIHGSFFPARFDAPGTRHCWCPNSRLRSEQLLDEDLFGDFSGTHQVGQGWNCWWFLGVSDFTNGTSTMTGESFIGKMLFFFFFWGVLMQIQVKVGGWVVAKYLKGIHMVKDNNFLPGNYLILAMKWRRICEPAKNTSVSYKVPKSTTW